MINGVDGKDPSPEPDEYALQGMGGVSDSVWRVLFENAIVSITDVSGRIIDVSEPFCRISGYGRHELRGQNHSLLKSGVHDQIFFEQMWHAISVGKTWRGAVCNRNKGGKLFWFQSTIIPDVDAQGVVLRYIAMYTDTTAHVELEKRLRQSLQLLRLLNDSLVVGIMMHRGGKLLYVNQAIVRMTGYSGGELLGMDYWELACPEHHDQIQARVAARLRGEPVDEKFVFRLNTCTGEEIWVESRGGTGEFHGEWALLVSVIDITDSWLGAQAQTRTQRMLGQVLGCHPVATMVLDRDHVVTHWNPALENLSGVSASEIVGTRTPWRGFYAEPRPILADMIIDGWDVAAMIDLYPGGFSSSLTVAGAYETEAFFSNLGPKGCWLFLTAAPLKDEQGQLIGAIETLQDISERKQAELTLRDELVGLVQARTIELDEAQRQLLQSEKLASIGQLAAGVAHEINNPIAYVHSNIGTLENYIADLFLALDDCLDGKRSAAAVDTAPKPLDLDFLREDIPLLMAEAKEGLVRVRRIVQDLKDFSHADSSQEWTWADLHVGLDSTLNVATNEIKYRAEVVKDYGSLPKIQCLPSQINQVFLNLLVNAAQAMPTERRGTITLRSGCQADVVWIEVADDGCGIPPENIKRIFDPFFTTKPVGKGTGLGLSLSYGIIQRHTGQLEVRSQIGQGTVFRVTLPIRQPVPDTLSST